MNVAYPQSSTAPDTSDLDRKMQDSVMKLTASREKLLAALQITSRAVSTRATLPSLGGIQLEAGDGGLTLRATDMELGLSTTVDDAQVESPGTVLLPGRLLGDVVRSLPPGEVTLALRAETRDVEITASNARFHLRTLPAEDFPRLPALDDDAATLPAPPLAETIERVARAASRDEVRPILTGVLFQAEGSTLTMVATDSYRLSVKHTELESALPTAIEANVPARALRELARIIAQGGAEEISLSLARNQAVFRVGGVLLSSRLIEGQFPSWRQLIPESFEHEVRLPREELLEVARRISQLAQRNAPLRFAFAEGELTVAAETPEVGDASEAIPAPYSGEPLEIAFNPQFVVEGIESVDGEELVMKLSSPLRPGLLEPVESEDFSYLVMPIRLNV
jgi:DNA polymerase III subunit beta